VYRDTKYIVSTIKTNYERCASISVFDTFTTQVSESGINDTFY